LDNENEASAKDGAREYGRVAGREASTEHLLNPRGVMARFVRERSDAHNRAIAESG